MHSSLLAAGKISVSSALTSFSCATPTYFDCLSHILILPLSTAPVFSSAHPKHGNPGATLPASSFFTFHFLRILRALRAKIFNLFQPQYYTLLSAFGFTLLIALSVIAVIERLGLTPGLAEIMLPSQTIMFT